jgi:hypothetical protein
LCARAQQVLAEVCVWTVDDDVIRITRTDAKHAAFAAAMARWK